MRLTDEQIELYSRQIILREVGGVGQTALRAARVLVSGAGAASEACVSYLVGAGVGTVHLADARAAGDVVVLPLPEPGRRTPDAATSWSSIDPASAHADYDAALHLSLDHVRPTSRPGEYPVSPVVDARLGSVVLCSDRHGCLHLLLLPRDRGCAACTRPQGTDLVANGSIGAGAIASASAGALAALVCCRWLLGIGNDDPARTLSLASGSAVWSDGAPPTRTACPRGCPPPAHPV